MKGCAGVFVAVGLVILMVLSVKPCQGQQAEGGAFKLISYNIWDGLSHHPDCRGKFVGWIKSQRPDVVALQELVGFTEAKLSALAAEYGHPHVAMVKEGGYPVGITSRLPIEVVNKFVKGYWHGMMHVKTYGLDLIVTHLSPFSWKFRLDEAQKISGYLARQGLTHCLVMGDLNAFSPFDADEVDTHVPLRQGMLAWDRQHPQWGNMKGKLFDYSVLSQLYASGLRDAIRLHVPVSKRMTYPAAFLYKVPWGTPSLKLRGERLDYILISDGLVSRLQGAAVHNGRETEGISDHYPVSVKLMLPVP